MKVAKKIGIVDKETGDKNLKKTVKIIQEYTWENTAKKTLNAYRQSIVIGV